MEDQTTQKPRIVLLYRASSKKQTDSENDIPLQRNILTQWAEQKGYEFVREFVEGGVSGFKVSASKRDAIIEIKAMAQRKEFDILGIYMSDRLGRIAGETPLIVSYLNEHNIKVISYNEGEINSSTHADKLMTYIRYWQAEGESLKTSLRVSDSIKDKILQGKWRGSSVPYGYRTVSRGTLNFKGKPIFDVEINPEEAEVVKTIFRLYTKEHYGTKLVAKYLNERDIKTTKGCMFGFGRIQSILTNKIYIGIYQHHKYDPRCNGKKNAPTSIIESPLMPDFVIVDNESYYEAQELLKKNSIMLSTKGQRRTVKGQMLNGLLHCGECGRKFTSHRYTTKRTKPNGELYIYEGARYKCCSYYYPTQREKTCKQGTYTASLLEQLVIKDAKEFILTTDKDKLLSNYKTQVEEQLSLSTKNLKRVELDISKIDKELIKLKSEVVKTLTGESNFSQELLNTLLQEKEQEKIALIPKQENLQQQVLQLQQNISIQSQLKENIDNWSTRFDNQSKEGKKAMLLNIIDKITLNKSKVEVEYKVQFNTSIEISTETQEKSLTLINYTGPNLSNIPTLSTQTTQTFPNSIPTPYFFDNCCVKGDSQAIQQV